MARRSRSLSTRRIKPAPTVARKSAWAALLIAALGVLALLWWFPEWRDTLAGRSAAPPVPQAPPPPQTQIFSGSGAAEFPIYAPQYPGSIVTNAQNMVDPAGSMMMIELSTADDPAKVAAFYNAVLKDKAFRPALREQNGQWIITAARPSAGLAVLVSVAAGRDGQAGGATASLTISNYILTPQGGRDGSKGKANDAVDRSI